MATSTATTGDEIAAWFEGRLPEDWTLDGPPAVVVDREEITVTISVAAPQLGDDASDAARAEAVAGRIAGFRDETRQQRISIAREAEHRFERKVAWGLQIDDQRVVFTHIAVPTMTRLRQPERRVLDTLIAAGVAKSRADALAWCVKLVGKNADEWLDDLRGAIDDVERIRAEGPSA
jgi:hypothetical protein